MKKLRMIVTSVIVLAIVGSAFAFNAKKVGVFCVDTSSPFNNTCDATVSGRYIVPTGGTSFQYYTNWSGKGSECTGSNCNTAIRLSLNDN